MCNFVYISTDSPDDLKKYNSDLVKFEPIADPASVLCYSLLKNQNKWYVASKSGCSCTFRHLLPESLSLGFHEPESWFKEDKDEIDATCELYRVLMRILESGYKLELIDHWCDTSPDNIIPLDVNLDDVSEKEFRLFEDHKFYLKKNKT